MRQYALITANYWAFTLTDGALRMLVVLHFHQLGYSSIEIAMLFIFYEFFGVVTNLFGGWLGAKFGLNQTMNIGLGIQIIALCMLLVPTGWLSVAWVMIAQALSGVAKDLNKMSAKSAIKMLVPSEGRGQLFKWVAVLTGSKNTLKGMGFFLGGLLLSVLGFRLALFVMAAVLTIVWLVSLVSLEKDLGQSKLKPKFSELFAKSKTINTLSAARMFLFASRDVWFVIALPIFLAQTFSWEFWQVGSFLSVWIIAYGLMQIFAPRITGESFSAQKQTLKWSALLLVIPVAITLAIISDWQLEVILVVGLLAYACVFAINSSLHSFLIVYFANSDGVSLDVGFYYMANAMGRLIGTLLSGWVFQAYGLSACLWVSAILIIITILISNLLPKEEIRA